MTAWSAASKRCCAGRQPAWSDSRFNTPLCLLRAMRALAEEPEPSYDRLVALFRAELAEGIAAHAAGR